MTLHDHDHDRGPKAAMLRTLIESFDRQLIELFERGDEPEADTIRAIAELEIARGAALRMLDRAAANEL